VSSAGQTYIVEMAISPYTSSNASACANPNGGLAMLKITIWVTWANAVSGTKWYETGNAASTGLLVSETTLLSLPSTAFNGNDGSILVDVSGAGGSTDGTEGVTLTATYGSTTYTAVTTASGCALFANLTPHTWTISGSETGYIDNLNDWSTSTNSASPLSTTVSVVAGTVSTANFIYDQEGTVTPTYSVTLAGATPWLPTGLSGVPLTFYTSANSATPPNGYVAASPALVYPYANSPSYHVVAGSCGVESSPAGTTDAGATTDGAAVTLTPGGQATPVIPLVPFSIVVSHGGAAVSNASISASVSSSDANCGTGTLAMPALGLGNSCVPGGPVTVPPSNCATLAAFRRHRGSKRYPVHAYLASACTSNCSTATVVTSSTNPSTYGSSVTFTATVTCTSSSTPCASPNVGTVTFNVGGTVESPITISSSGSGQATFTAPSLGDGTTTVTATYNKSTGAKWLSSSASSPFTQTVDAPTTTSLTSSPNPNGYGSSATLTATVTPAGGATGPTGTVKFTNGGVTIPGCSAVSVTPGSTTGTASCLDSAFVTGPYTLQAVYTGTGIFIGSTSTTVTQTVTAATTTSTLTSSSLFNTSTFGASVTFTDTVTPAGGGTPAGTVAFKANGTAITGCTAQTLNGSAVASCITTALAAGSDTITAVFTPSNSAEFATSTGTVNQLVYREGTTPSIETGLPYGSWILSVSYTPTVGGTTYTATYYMLINQAGIYVGSTTSNEALVTSFPIQLSD
jgi:hypothetical protein